MNWYGTEINYGCKLVAAELILKIEFQDKTQKVRKTYITGKHYVKEICAENNFVGSHEMGVFGMVLPLMKELLLQNVQTSTNLMYKWLYAVYEFRKIQMNRINAHYKIMSRFCRL